MTGLVICWAPFFLQENVLSPPHTVATLRDCPREDWLATHEDRLATGISTSFWRLQKTEHVRSSVPTSCRLQVAQSLHSVRLALDTSPTSIVFFPNADTSDVILFIKKLSGQLFWSLWTESTLSNFEQFHRANACLIRASLYLYGIYSPRYCRLNWYCEL